MLNSDTKFHRDLINYCPYIIKNTSAMNKYAKQMRGYNNVRINFKKDEEQTTTGGGTGQETFEYLH